MKTTTPHFESKTTSSEPKDAALQYQSQISQFHKNRAWLVIVSVLLALAVVSYFGLKNNHESVLPQAQVTVSSQSFIPQTISVKAGTMVTWTNKDSSPHQVAADPYPKNNSIPNFDSTEVLQTNDSYSYTFNQKGTYYYHDQLNPLKQLGTVIVK